MYFEIYKVSIINILSGSINVGWLTDPGGADPNPSFKKKKRDRPIFILTKFTLNFFLYSHYNLYIIRTDQGRRADPSQLQPNPDPDSTVKKTGPGSDPQKALGSDRIRIHHRDKTFT